MSGREFTEEVPTQRVEPGEPKGLVQVLIGVPSPEGVAPALGHIGPHPAGHPLVEPVQHPATLCPLEVLSPAPQMLIEPPHQHRQTHPGRPPRELPHPARESAPPPSG